MPEEDQLPLLRGKGRRKRGRGGEGVQLLRLPPSLPEFLALRHKSRLLGLSSNPVCGFFVMEQVRLCAVWPTENWLGSSLNQIQGWTAVPESYSRPLEQEPLFLTVRSRTHAIWEWRGKVTFLPLREGRSSNITFIIYLAIDILQLLSDIVADTISDRFCADSPYVMRSLNMLICT